MKHEIEIEGLPEGWEPVAFRIPEQGEHFYTDGNVEFSVTASLPYLIVKKKQPRRIVLEEIPDDLVSSSFSETVVRIGNKWWREVKESDLSLHNTDDKESLRLTREQCRELLQFSSSAIEMIKDFLRNKS